MLNWYQNGINVKCPVCGGEMYVYEGDDTTQVLTCEHEDCNCNIRLTGIMFDGDCDVSQKE